MDGKLRLLMESLPPGYQLPSGPGPGQLAPGVDPGDVQGLCEGVRQQREQLAEFIRFESGLTDPSELAAFREDLGRHLARSIVDWPTSMTDDPEAWAAIGQPSSCEAFQECSQDVRAIAKYEIQPPLYRALRRLFATRLRVEGVEL